MFQPKVVFLMNLSLQKLSQFKMNNGIDKGNYRSVIVLSHLSKVSERIVNELK